MKLHLPKGLLAAVLAVLSFSSIQAAETEYDYDLLADKNTWTFNGTSYIEETHAISASNWGGNKYATYQVQNGGKYVVDESGILTFTLTYTVSGDNAVDNSVQTFALVGDEYAIVFGTERFTYEDQTKCSTIGYGTTANVNATHYGVSSGTPAVTLTPYENATRTNPGEYTITGTVTYENNKYSLTTTLTSGSNTYTSNALDLGDTFNISRFVFTSEGDTRSLTNLQIAGTKSYEAYSYISTLGSGTTQASDATWYHGDSKVTDIDFTNNTAKLYISGASEGSTLVLQNGANLDVIEATSNQVTIQSDGTTGISVNELRTQRNTTLVIDTKISNNVQAALIKGAGTIQLNQDASFSKGLQLDASVSIASGKTLSMGGDITGAGVITGEGAVNLTSGTWTVTTEQTYTGGTTVASGSELILQKGGQPGALRGTVDVYGTLTANTGDVTGWGNSTDVISAINIHKGGTMHIATTSNQTAAGLAINLIGGSLTGVAKSNLDLFYGGGNKNAKISALAAEDATAEAPTISTISGVQLGLRQRNNEFYVADKAALVIKSNIADRTGAGSGSDEPAGTTTITKSGAGKLTLAGTAKTLGYQVQLTGGTLQLGGTETTDGLMSLTAGINQSADTTLQITGKASLSGDSTLGGAIVVDSTGNLTLGQTYTLTGSLSVATGGIITGSANMTKGEGSTAPAEGTNGWSSTNIIVLQTADSNTQNVTGLNTLTWTDGKNYSITSSSSNGITSYSALLAADYYVQDTSTKAEYSAESGLANAGKIYMANGTTLKITQDMNTDKIALLSNDAWVKYEVDGADVMLNGNARADLDITNGGKVTVEGIYQAIGTRDKNSQVRLNHGTLQLHNGWGPAYVAYANCDILIEEEGTVAGSKLNNLGELTGTIKGNGILTITQGSAEKPNSWKISSTISDGETGKLSVVKDGNVDITVTGDNTYTGGTTVKNGTLITENENALGKGKVTMEGGTLKQNTALSVSAMDYKGGAVNNNGSKLTVTGALDVKAGMSIAGAGETEIGTLSMSEGYYKLTAEGSLTIGQLSLDLSLFTDKSQSYTLAEVSGTDSLITLTNAYTSTVGNYTATVTGDGTRALTLSFSANPTDTPDWSILGLDGYNSETGMLTLEVGANLLDYDFTKDGAIIIPGIDSKLMQDILGLGALPEDGMVGIQLKGADDEILAATKDGQIGFQGETGIYYGQQVGSNWQYYVHHIPEPATATLSLLALCGLAARRRRK